LDEDRQEVSSQGRKGTDGITEIDHKTWKIDQSRRAALAEPLACFRGRYWQDGKLTARFGGLNMAAKQISERP
jgi:hypothetical protein